MLDLDELKEKQNIKDEPLAAKMRPRSIDEVIGQDELLGPGKTLRKILENGTLVSMIFWGPPGCGKTTIAELIASYIKARFVRVSAVTSGVADLRRAIDEAKMHKKSYGTRTILFIDEIHRFNKSQQDSILPYVEDGTVILIGATTQNPSFEVNSALLSRSRLFVLKALSDKDIEKVLENSLNDDDRGYGRYKFDIEEGILNSIAQFSNGDARVALNVLELAVNIAEKKNDKLILNIESLKKVFQSKALPYDKNGEFHYDLISALHKSLRGSDPDASLYYLGRIIEAGEDPLFIARRLIRFASEDVGIADSQALVICIAAQQAVSFVGLPEAVLALAQAVVYLAVAPKSNALYEAYSKVIEDVKNTRDDPVPMHLRNAPTAMMKKLGYSKGYLYSHDFYKKLSIDDSNRPPVEKLQDYLPENLKGREYYNPTIQGREKAIKEWLDKRRTKK